MFVCDCYICADSDLFHMDVVYAFGWNTGRIKKRHSYVCSDCVF